MKTNDLIESLSSQVKPIKIVKFNATDVIKILMSGLFCILAAIVILGIRADMDELIVSIQFFIEIGLLLALAIASIFAALTLSIPSVETRNIYKYPILIFFLFLALMLYSFFKFSNPFFYFGHGFKCFYEVVLISILPASILFYFVRKAAPIRRDIVGGLVLLSGATFGLLGVQLTCIDSSPLHILFWHITPFLVVTIFGISISKLIFKKI